MESESNPIGGEEMSILTDQAAEIAKDIEQAAAHCKRAEEGLKPISAGIEELDADVDRAAKELEVDAKGIKDFAKQMAEKTRG